MDMVKILKSPQPSSPQEKTVLPTQSPPPIIYPFTVSHPMLKVASKEVPRLGEVSCPLVPSESHVRETAFRFCREFLQGSWRTILFSDMLIHKVSGGLNNLLYLCEIPEHIVLTQGEPRKVLVRFYGQVNRERALETLTTECIILTLVSERQRGPRLYGIFPGGRLEEYIPARPLLTAELAHPNISSRLAEKLAEIHLMDVPMNKSPTRMWESVERWVCQIEDLLEQDPPITAELADMVKRLQSLNLRSELAWLREFLERIQSPVVFCHNDLQEGNILLRTRSEEEPRLEDVTVDDLVIIDFEYCCYNHRGFDIANHFVEWMYDYKNTSHPYFWARPLADHASIQQKEMFVNAYLSALRSSTAYKPHPEDSVDHIVTEVNHYILASHFFWALWSVVSTSNMFTRVLEFDYWCYGESRFEAYYSHKQQLLDKSSSA